IYYYNIYVVKNNFMSSKVVDKKLKVITRSIRFERKDWEELSELSIKLDLPISHLIRKAVKQLIKSEID
ncbi:MAG: ribbon-helix-helix domain-containing protein, partial [Cyanobacteria bacterium P01_G01_bin.39]